MAIALADLLNPDHIDLDLRTRSVEIALRKVMRLMAVDEQIGDQEKFLQQVLARERENPSVVEAGVAFPHTRTDLVNKIVLGIGRSRAGIPFAKTGRARLIFLIGVPQRLVNDYLVCVGALARVLKDDIIRNRLFSVETPQEFITILREADQDPLAASA